MKKALVAAFLLFVPFLASAEWKVERGIKVGSLHDDQVGIIATLPAKSTFKPNFNSFAVSSPAPSA